MKFLGHVSPTLGSHCASLLRAQLAGTPVLGFFCDAEAPGTIDLSARSSIVRAFLDNRRHLESMATLVGTPIVAPTVRAIATVHGLAHIAESSEDFHAILVRAAPYAQTKLPRDKWTRTMVSDGSVRPSARSRAEPRRH